MLHSMTGFGRAKIETTEYIFTAEAKSLNSKSADITIRLPRRFSDKEIELRNKLTHSLERGKISLSIDFEIKNHHEIPRSHINKELAKAYYLDIKSLAESLSSIDEASIFSQALKMQGVIQETKEQEVSEGENQHLYACVDEAILECKKFRADEGKVLQETLISYIHHIETLLHKVNEHDPSRIEAVRNRITTHVHELISNDSFDKNRFEQEMIFYIEKLDISEEKVRLANHLQYFLNTMKEEAPGRKLGFISQEIGREINTIGSKANDVVVQKLVVEMKDYLEKIKEQSLNIL